MIAVGAVQVSVVDVVEVAFVHDRDVAAARPVDVGVAAFVDVVLGSHRPKLARGPAAGEQPLMGLSRRPRVGQSPAG